MEQNIGKNNKKKSHKIVINKKGGLPTIKSDNYKDNLYSQVDYLREKRIMEIKAVSGSPNHALCRFSKPSFPKIRLSVPKLGFKISFHKKPTTITDNNRGKKKATLKNSAPFTFL